jgi:hypothetical protein
MLYRSSFGRLAMVTLGCFAGAVVCALAALAYWYDVEKHIDALCAYKSWELVGICVESDASLHWPFVGAQRPGQASPAQLLRQYFNDLAVPSTNSSEKANSAEPSAEAVAVISERAKFYEKQWHLAHLSEAYGRCAVGLCRKRAKAALLQVATDKQGAAESLAALAKSLRHLAELYQNHGKYLIAERALKECTDVATQAFALADQKSAERFRAEVLVDYGAHIKILNDLGRTPEAEHESKLLLEQ